MRWTLNGSVAMNGREREGWEGVERLQEGSKGLSYTGEWALAGNQRVASLSNKSDDATRKESTCKLIFTKRKGRVGVRFEGAIMAVKVQCGMAVSDAIMVYWCINFVGFLYTMKKFHMLIKTC